MPHNPSSSNKMDNIGTSPNVDGATRLLILTASAASGVRNQIFVQPYIRVSGGATEMIFVTRKTDSKLLDDQIWTMKFTFEDTVTF